MYKLIVIAEYISQCKDFIKYNNLDEDKVIMANSTRHVRGLKSIPYIVLTFPPEWIDMESYLDCHGHKVIEYSLLKDEDLNEFRRSN